MHIGFRTSGGRGEYELVGSHSGYTAASLDGWEFYMAWPDGVVRRTGLWCDQAESGKPRLRSLLTQPIQIGRIVASMLMLPDPARTYKATPSTEPIAMAKKYSITQVGFGPDSEFSGITDRVTFTPSWIEIANQGGREAIGVEGRWKRIQAVYKRASEFAPNVRDLIRQHADFIASKEVVNQSLTTVVKQLNEALAGSVDQVGEPNSDPLTTLELYLEIPELDEPALPPPDELSEDEPEISLRSAHQYRLAKTRGAAGRKFGKSVLSAYNGRCAFCGARFGGLEGVRSGIDAAHILAWSKHDLDQVPNGLALCKLHHWAFDAGLFLLRWEEESYVLRFTTLADNLDPAAQERLGQEGFTLPHEWLPTDPDLQPLPRYLDLTYADLGVTFRSDSA